MYNTIVKVSKQEKYTDHKPSHSMIILRDAKSEKGSGLVSKPDPPPPAFTSFRINKLHVYPERTKRCRGSSLILRLGLDKHVASNQPLPPPRMHNYTQLIKRKLHTK